MPSQARWWGRNAGRCRAHILAKKVCAQAYVKQLGSKGVHPAELLDIKPGGGHRAHILAKKVSPRAFVEQPGKKGQATGEVGIEGTTIEAPDAVRSPEPQTLNLCAYAAGYEGAGGGRGWHCGHHHRGTRCGVKPSINAVMQPGAGNLHALRMSQLIVTWGVLDAGPLGSMLRVSALLHFEQDVLDQVPCRSPTAHDPHARAWRSNVDATSNNQICWSQYACTGCRARRRWRS